MTKFILAIGLASLLAACSSMGTSSRTGSSGVSSTTMGSGAAVRAGSNPNDSFGGGPN